MQQHSWKSCTALSPLQQPQTKALVPYLRQQVVAAAVRKRPGRVTGKQSGSAYYQNYLKNRREKGGEFLGPSSLLLTAQQKQQGQQQQQEELSRLQQQQPDQQEQHLAEGETLQQQEQGLSSQVTPYGHTSTTQQQQQQQHELQQPQEGSPPSPPYQGLAAAPLNPTRFQQLLEQCLAATAPLPLIHTTPPLDHALPQHQHHQQQQQQVVVLSPVEQQRQASRQLNPRRLPDYVTPDLADGLVKLLKPRRGVTIWQPQLTPMEPLIPLPPLPPLSPATSSNRHTNSQTPAATTTGSSSSNSDDSHSSSSSSSSSDSSVGVPHFHRQRVLHVFWDVSSLHPGGYDPRVLVSQLRRVLGCYGRVGGVYAYGIQKLFNWIPEAFMLQYAPDRLPGRKCAQQQQPQQQQQPAVNIQAQQQEVRQLLEQATAAGVSLEDTLGPLRCRVCGKLRDNYSQLHAHMVQRHKQPAPPLEKLLPDGAVAAMAAAAIAATGSQGGSSKAVSEGPHGSDTRGRQPAAGAAGGYNWKVADPWAMRNSSTRTLGRVTRYFNSRGDQFIPPDGHQMSLKYVLVREGVEVRTVQRQARAVSAAVADGLHGFLHGRLLRRSAQEVQEMQDVLVVVSDKATHAAVLQEAQRAGVLVVAVCGKMKRYQGADVTLRWQWVATGRYDCADGTDAGSR